MRHAWRETSLSRVDLGAGRFRRQQSGLLVFAGRDDAGELDVCVTVMHFEQLKADAPAMSDAEDRHDYALGMIEAEAAMQAPSVTAEGRRIVFVG